jgi:SET domain
MVATATQLTISQHGFAAVLQAAETGARFLYSTQAFVPGDIICPFSAAAVFDKPSYLTVQTGDDTHITLDPSFLQYVNHSCQPNAFFDTKAMQLVCIAPITPGEQFTFFYPSTEWEMAQPFDCQCGTPSCIGQITGASQISEEVLSRYRLTEYIIAKL